ncbi:disease resistance protein, partial [Trifolium medium]|nr:disease resistance protein [Trifolium medium]
MSRWVLVRDSEMWNVEQKKDDILPALKLSYDQMPSHLRQCFAYFSLYPKDHIFSSYVMCSLWVALGLVQSQKGSEKLESIARKYIDELHSRSFIQDVNEYGSFCDFKVHDLIHDLALYVTREDFVAVDSHTQNIPQQVRHLSVVEKEALGRVSFPKSRSVRSILYPIFGFGLENESVMDTWTLYISDCVSLNLLLINESPVETLRLKHLHLRGFTMLVTLPGWIECAMDTLETLEISIFSDLKMLPVFLTTMTCLKRLYINYCPQLSSLTSDMHRLTALEDLRIKGCPELCRKCQPQS